MTTTHLSWSEHDDWRARAAPVGSIVEVELFERAKMRIVVIDELRESGVTGAGHVLEVTAGHVLPTMPPVA